LIDRKPKGIHGPDQVFGAMSEAQHEAAYHAALRRRSIQSWVYVGQPIEVYINHSRSLIDCPNCGAGVSVSETWRRGLCRECGGDFQSAALSFPPPPALEQIRAILAERPLKHRNWRPDESPDDLNKENRERGLPEVAVVDAIEAAQRRQP
jgi:hypothetical protein